MKVIYVCAKSFYFTEGFRGSVLHAKGIVEGLLANDCKVEIVSGPGISKFFDGHDNLRVTTIGEKQENFLGELLWRKKLLNYLKNNVERFDLLLLRYGFSNPLLSCRISRICKKSSCYSVLEVNSLGADYKNRIIFFRSLIKSFEVKVLSLFNLIYVVSKEEKKRIKEKQENIDIVVIPNATHNKILASETESDLTRFVYLGSLIHYYNFNEVVQSFKQIVNDNSKNLELIVYGDGPMDDLLREYAIKDSRIKMMGKYDNNAITELINRYTDILLLPYKKGTIAEIGSPMKLFEYLALGAPILASNVGQIKDIIRHKENGYIYKTENDSDLTDKMNYLIDHKEERINIGLQAHKESINKHTWKKRMSKLLKAYNIS